LSEKQEGSFCSQCGAPMGGEKKDAAPALRRSDPFFYNGYICYSLYNPHNDTYEAQFWLGQLLIERIAVSSLVMNEFVREYEDPMSFFWNLFLVAHGEKEVLEWQEKNNKYPATFEIRKIANPELERIRGLSMYDLAQEARR
jgi:hypothetical protein